MFIILLKPLVAVAWRIKWVTKVFFSAIYDKPKKGGGLQSKIMGPSVSKYSCEPNIGVSQI